MPATHNFSNVFISYAHEDKEFVQRLNNALQARGYQTWIDEEDVPFSAPISQEAMAGIEAAETFVFVVSKASARSRPCKQEIEHAARHNKRIIPVQFEDVQDVTFDYLPPVIRDPRWLNFTGSDGSTFAQSFENLIGIIETDLEYEQQHTRYLVKAREWEQSQRDKSYLMTGSDAAEAMEWLYRGKTDEALTLPTSLQEEYIRASEQKRVEEVAFRYVERRTLPAFVFTWGVIWFYFNSVFPGHLPEMTRPPGDVVFELAFGVGITAGVILAALVLYADELITIRYANDRRFRFIGSFVYSFALAGSVSGFLQAMTFGPRLDLMTVFAGWIGFGLTAMLRATFKLRGWQAFFINIVAITLMLNLTAAVGQPWEGERIALFYFENYEQFYALTPWMAVLISIGAYGWLLAEDLYGLWRWQSNRRNALRQPAEPAPE